jgi:fructose 5-dehydrogenase small subunit
MGNESKSGTEATPAVEIPDAAAVSRRRVLAGAASAFAVTVFGASFLRIAQSAAAANSVSADKFMVASNFLIQHRLSSGVGVRLAGILQTRIPTLDADLGTIIQVAKEKNAKVVEDFFDALPDGTVKDTAHDIIFGWYAGVVDESPTAEVFAYEEALMYQPTRDAVALPTYSFNGPNHWTDVDPPLSAMPEF